MAGMIKLPQRSVARKARVDTNLAGSTAAIPSWADRCDNKIGARATVTRARADGAHSRCLGAWLTVAQAAAQLQLSEKTVRRLIRKGELHAVALGRSLRLRLPGLNTK